MTLIDRYIGEVKRRLPANEREDIGQELRSTLEDMLPVGYTEEEERELLMKFGNPAVLAGKYRSQPMYLIGPRYFDLYITLLKIIISIVFTVVLVILIITTIFSGIGETSVLNVIGNLIGKSFSAAFDVAFNVLFWVTLVFVIIEWTDRASQTAGKRPFDWPGKSWTPDELKKIQETPKKKLIARSEPAFDLIWTVIWVSVYFNTDHLVGIYEEGSGGIELVTPIFDQAVLLSYWPFVLLVILLQVVMDIWKWRQRRWDKKLALLNLVAQTLSVLVFILVFRNSEVFAPEFLSRLEGIFGSLNALNWVIGGLIFTVLLFSVIDIFQGFRKARIRGGMPLNGWKKA